MSIANIKRSETFIKLLPAEIRSTIKQTQEEWKRLLFENIEAALNGTDIDAIDYWIDSLNTYVTSEAFTLTIEEIEKIALILYKFIINSKYLTLVTETIPTFLILVDPNFKLDISFDWRPIYDNIFSYGLSNSKRKSHKILNVYLQTLLPFIDACQRYFPLNATEEILAEFNPIWNPKNMIFSIGLTLTSIFLPVNRGKHNLWFNDIISKYALFNSVIADFVFLPLFVKLSFQNTPDLDWSPHVPFFFHKLSLFLQIPVIPINLSNDRPEEASFNLEMAQFFLPDEIDDNEICQKYCTILVNLLSVQTSKEIVREHLIKLLLLIAPLHSPLPQNASDKVITLTVDFLNSLVLCYCRRVRADRRNKNFIPPLTEDDHQWFVSSILPVYVLELYGDSQCEQLNQLVQLVPSITIPPIFDVIQRLTDYQHLKEPALRTMCMIAPTIIVSKEMLDPFKIILTPFVDDITASDVETSKWVFKLFQILAWSIPIDDSLCDWAYSVARQCANFATAAIGEDFAEALSMMEVMLSAILKATEPHIHKGMIQIVENCLNEVSIENMKYLIDSLEPVSYGKWCFNELTERNMVIVMCLVRSSNNFIDIYKDKILDFIKESINSENKKVRGQTYSLTKWALRALIRNVPRYPLKQGVSKISEESIFWRHSTEESASKAIQIVDEIFPLIKEKFSKNDRQDQRFAVKIASFIVKGVVCGSSAFDFEYDAPKYPRAQLFQFSFPQISRKLEEVIDWLISIASTDLHHKVISTIIDAFSSAVVPMDNMAFRDKIIGTRLGTLWNETKLSILMPSLESMLPIHHFWIALKLYSNWLQSDEIPFTKFADKIVQCTMKFILSPFPSVRSAISNTLMLALKFYMNELAPLTTDLIQNFTQSIGNAPVQSLSTISAVLGFFSVSIDQSENISFIVDVALAICQQLPPDVPDDWLMVLRNTIAVLIDGTDFSMPPYNSEKVYKDRKRLIKGAIEQSKKYTNSQDTQNFALALICSVIEGDPQIFDEDVIEFIMPFLKSEDPSTCEITLQTVTNILEQLIPRDLVSERSIKCNTSIEENVNVENNTKSDDTESLEDDEKSNDIDLVSIACEKFASMHDNKIIEKVDESNYDTFDFYDTCIRRPKIHRSRLMSRDESQNEEFVSKYFKLNVDSRIAAHSVIYKFFLDDPDFTAKLVSLFVNFQTHDEESFYYRRFLFWRSLVRFCGTAFANKVLKICLESPEDDMATLYIVSEIVSGVLAAMKSFLYDQIKEIQPLLFEFLQKRLTSPNTNSTFSWFIVITSSISFYDSRRYLWLFEFLRKLEVDDSPKGFRQRGEIARLLTIFTGNNKELFSDVFPKYVEPLFSTKVLALDNQRNNVIDFLITVFDDCLPKDWIDIKSQFFYDYILPADDRFIAQFIAELYNMHSFASISALSMCIDNIEEWMKSLTEEKDEEDQEIGTRAISSLMMSDIIPAVATLPLTKESSRPMVIRVLEQMITSEKSWPTQVNVLSQLLLFISSSYFLIDEKLIEDIIWDVISPALIYPNSDVQDSASILLAFIFKSFGSIRAKISVFSTMFGKMLVDEEAAQRIAGAKGLFSIVWATLIFDDVPEYITSAFSALQDAAETDSTVTECINQFFCEFWSEHEENFTENAAIQLSPYRDSLRPSYIS